MSLFGGIQLFDSLTEVERNTLSLFCQERFLPHGEVLFYEGDDAAALYIVKSGTLKAYKERSDGEQFLGEIQPNELAGEMAIFDPEFPYKRIASVSAETDTLLLVILKEAILQLSTKHPEVFEKISHIIKKRRNISL
ncbi:hypothetical protein AUK10_01190 [Candidatus Gracilibacteria bacterium CG2_30_37_12]|nr:MAG: hypothetical protein AUK10_01190 [Candidatus Gracilibacteria bacterium CG2_30_37_12]